MRDIEESHFEDHPSVISLQQDHLQIQISPDCPPVLFSVHFLLIGEISMAKVFVQILGSRYEAMLYNYAIKVEDPKFGGFGKYYHESQVKSLDDKKEELFESNACLILPLEMLRKYIGKEFKFTVEIEELDFCCEHHGKNVALLPGQLSQKY